MKTKIGFFDSGIGGVTVLNECIKTNPNFEYIYYSDSINNPYGDKDYNYIISEISKIVDYLIDRGCYIIVIACNTASAIGVSYLRDKYPNIQFVAIEPAIKLAYDKDGGTLIMATKGTLDSEKFHLLYDKYHNDKCYLLPCIGLANIIESGNCDDISKYLDKHLSLYKGKVSNVVLGCTHYPLIKNEISNILGNVNFYDGSVGVSKRLSNIIYSNGYVDDKFSIEFIDSSNDESKKSRFFTLLEVDNSEYN